MIEILILLNAGNNNRNLKNILKVLENIKYNETTKEFVCKSLSNETKNKQIYSDSPKDWFCECEAKSYMDTNFLMTQKK